MDLADLKISWRALMESYISERIHNKNFIIRQGIYDNDKKKRFVGLYDKSKRDYVDYYIIYKRNDGLWYMDHPRWYDRRDSIHTASKLK